MSLSSSALSDRIYNRIEAKFGKLPKAARGAFRKFTDAVAEGFLEFLDNDMTVEVTVTTQTVVSQGGLQTESSGGGTGPTGLPLPVSSVPTGAPVSPVTLTGTGTGTGKFK